MLCCFISYDLCNDIIDNILTNNYLLRYLDPQDSWGNRRMRRQCIYQAVFRSLELRLITMISDIM